jgi:hypothetical protein
MICDVEGSGIRRYCITIYILEEVIRNYTSLN